MAKLGVVEWFAFQQYGKVESAVKDLSELGAREMRTLFSWAEFNMAGGLQWFDWFVPRLGASGAKLLPALFYTPVELARPDSKGRRRVSHPPLDLAGFAEFTAEMISRYGDYFDWIQLWNEPNWKVYWEEELDPDFSLFAAMFIAAAELAHAKGKKVVFGGMTPYEPTFVTIMHQLGVLKHLDAISIHYSPSWRQHRRWFGWENELANLQALLRGHGHECEIWVTETGISTMAQTESELRAKEQEQIEYLKFLKKLPVERVYWAFIYDQEPERLTDDAINLGVAPDQTAYHFGLKKHDGQPKPIFEYWRSGKETF